MELTTWPRPPLLYEAAQNTPEWMHPNVVPFAVILKRFLDDEQCTAIQESLDILEPYTSLGCGAATRECHADPTLDPIEQAARIANDSFFHFNLDEGQHSWLQTYDAGGKYQRHMDAIPGQTRKLTAVALLSNAEDYMGGNLTMYVTPKELTIPRARGTIVVFQSWVEHEVTPVTLGSRQTINMGFWGPPFL